MKFGARYFPATVVMVSLAGCAASLFQAVDVNPKTGYLPAARTHEGDIKRGNVVSHENIDLKKYQGRILVTDGKFFKDEMVDIGAFSDVFDAEDLQKRIIAAGLQDKVPSASDLIGFNRAYTNYGPFLWMHFKMKDEFGGRFLRMIITDPGSGQDVFVANVSACGQVFCENDQDTFYPLFNSLIDWVRGNGGTIKLAHSS